MRWRINGLHRVPLPYRFVPRSRRPTNRTVKIFSQGVLPGGASQHAQVRVRLSVQLARHLALPSSSVVLCVWTFGGLTMRFGRAMHVSPIRTDKADADARNVHASSRV